jgi:hypothetical protein
MTASGEPSRSPPTAVPLVAMPNLAVRAEFVPTPSAASAVAERSAVFPRAEAPASAVVASAVAVDFAAEADATERSQF